MQDIHVIEGNFVGVAEARYALVVGRFNSFVVESLVAGALDTLKRHGVPDASITLARCPGAWELPLLARKMVATGRFDAVIALGAVIRGGTPHFDYVAGECAKGLGVVQLESSVPVIFGVLTTDSIEQAIERSGTKAGNKGNDAALAAMEMVSLLKQVS